MTIMKRLIDLYVSAPSESHGMIWQMSEDLFNRMCVERQLPGDPSLHKTLFGLPILIKASADGTDAALLPGQTAERS